MASTNNASTRSIQIAIRPSTVNGLTFESTKRIATGVIFGSMLLAVSMIGYFSLAH